MKILKIEICNLASLGAETIDFTKGELASAPLILICGPTGSGKSTILDAVCLALYGDAPRLTELSGNRKAEEGGWKISSPFHLVRRNSDKCYCHVTFEANNGRVYTAKWTVGFYVRGDKKGAPQSVSRTLLDVETGEEIELKGKENSLDSNEYIGLDYDQFRRTTLLAQGDFSRFLKGNDNEKCGILERLVGVEKFTEYGERIRAKYAEAKSAKEMAEAEIRGITVLTAEAVAALERQFNEAREQSEKLGTELSKIVAIANWLANDKLDSQQLAAAEEKLKEATALAQSEEMAQLRAMVSRWDSLEPLRQANAEIKSKQADIEAEVRKMKAYAALRAKLANTKRTVEERMAELAEKMAAAAAELKAFSEADMLLVDNARVVAERLSLHQEAYATLQKAERIEEEKHRGIDEETERLASGNVEERIEYRKKLSDLVEKYELLQKVERFNALGKELEALETALKQASAVHDEARARYDRVALSTDNAAKTLRSKLVSGEKCPVCGSVVDEVAVDEAFEEALRPIREEYEQALAAKTAADERHKEKKAETAAAKKLLGANVPPPETLREQVAELQAQAQAEAADAARLIPQVDEEIGRMSQALKAVGEWRQAKANVEARRNDLTARTLSVAEFLKDLPEKIDYAGEKKRVEGLVSRHDKLLKEQEKDQVRADDMGRLFKSLGEALEFTKELPDEATEAAVALGEAEQMASQLRFGYENTLIRLGELNSRLKESEDVRKGIIGNLPDELQEFVEDPSLGQTAESVKASRAKASKVDKEVSEAKGAFENAAARHKAHLEQKPQTELTPEQVESEKERLTVEKEAADRTAGSLEAQIKADKDAKKRFDAALVRADEARRLHGEWKQLDELLGGDRFKKFVCSEILSHLIAGANHYFAMFQKRYKMEIAPGSFEVMVHDKELHRSRVFSSLSGGETFMVSLSLALGLAALSKVRFTCDTLFIDEGFGTLSSDCLDAVMDSLDRLHEFENRRVVVISHVEMLRDRIPVQLFVKQSGSKSTIEIGGIG